MSFYSITFWIHIERSKDGLFIFSSKQVTGKKPLSIWARSSNWRRIFLYLDTYDSHDFYKNYELLWNFINIYYSFADSVKIVFGINQL